MSALGEAGRRRPGFRMPFSGTAASPQAVFSVRDTPP